MSEGPETVENLCFRLRELADHAMFQIDADRLRRVAAEIAALQARVNALVDGWITSNTTIIFHQMLSFV